MNRAFCFPIKQGDLIDLDFLATNSNYQLELPYYMLVYNNKIFTCIKGGITIPKAALGYFYRKPTLSYVYFKEVGVPPSVHGIYTLLVADNAPVNATYYIHLEGYEKADGALPLNTNQTAYSLVGQEGDVLRPPERRAPKEKIALYVTIQDPNPHSGSKNEPPSIALEAQNAITIDKQTTKADTYGNPVYIIDASITTTLEEAKKLQLDKIGKQITFHDKDDITRIEVDILQSPNKSTIKPDFTYKGTAQRFFTPTKVNLIGKEIKIPFIDVRFYTWHKEKVVKQGVPIPIHSYLFSQKQWPEVGICPGIEKDQISQLAPVRITAYDGAGAKTIVNLSFKDKTLGK